MKKYSTLNMSKVLIIATIFPIFGVHICAAYLTSPNLLKSSVYGGGPTCFVNSARKNRIGVAGIAMQNQRETVPKKDFLDMFVGAVSGLVSVTGSTIDYRNADDRPLEMKPAVDNDESQ